MDSKNKIWIGTGASPVYLLPRMANRHGFIAGDNSIDKASTLRVLTECFSQLGVPVFLPDIKGDLSGLAAKTNPDSFSVRFWDLYGQYGHPVRAAVSEMGSLMLSRIMELNETQSGVLNIIFRIADDKGLLLLDLKDLKSMLQYVGENGREFALAYGNISKQTIGAIIRNLLILEDQGGSHFFGEPQLDISDLIKTTRDGHGYINILHSTRLSLIPSLYSTWMLWLLSELFEALPDTGDFEKPKMIFFFDEAQLLFHGVPKSLLDKIEQMLRLIGPKGVGVYFITKNPSDLPPNILDLMGSRIQHGLKTFTPSEKKNTAAAAEVFRPNPAFDTAETIAQLAPGEALISCLDEEGCPGIAERAFILAPRSQREPVRDEIRMKIINDSDLKGKYDIEKDRESAFEMLRDRSRSPVSAPVKTPAKAPEVNSGRRGYVRQTPLEKAAGAVLSTVGREVGRTLIRGLLGSLKK